METRSEMLQFIDVTIWMLEEVVKKDNAYYGTGEDFQPPEEVVLRVVSLGRQFLLGERPLSLSEWKKFDLGLYVVRVVEMAYPEIAKRLYRIDTYFDKILK